MTGKGPHKALDLSGAKMYPLATRQSKVDKDLLADPDAYRPADPGGPEQRVENLIPSILKGRDIKELADAWASAVSRRRAVILGMGAHPIKVGLSRLIIDLMERGFLHVLAAGGAVAIHDVEMALQGQTSEEVAEGLPEGSFGMAEDTGRAYWEAVALAEREGYGLGQAVGRLISEGEFPYRRLSVLAAAYEREVPATLHVAVGSDIVHMHPAAQQSDRVAALGRAAFRDFQVLSEAVKGLDDGGVYINLGSAVILPEVFLKAVNVARNLEGKPQKIVTANLDMIQHYRPAVNVVQRPTQPDGRGYQITGHHEILFPLLYAMVRDRLS
ncbi:MAG: hypothetical protein ACE5JS_05620 [Nitrospinota bacterium]